MTPADLCRKIGIKQSSLWSIENDVTKTLKASTLLRAAAALDANPIWIQTGRGDPFKMEGGSNQELIDLYENMPSDHQAALIAAARALSNPK